MQYYYFFSLDYSGGLPNNPLVNIFYKVQGDQAFFIFRNYKKTLILATKDLSEPASVYQIQNTSQRTL